MVSRENKESYLMSLSCDTINSRDIFNLFNKQTGLDKDGNTIVTPALYEPTDPIHVRAGKLACIKKDIDTTVGRYIFNLVTIEYAFRGSIEFINKTIRDDEFEDFQKFLCDEILMGRVSGEAFGKFQTRVVNLNNFTELFVPGVSLNLLVLPEEIKVELQRLITENKEVILTNNVIEYLNKVEKPIIEFARKWFIDHKEPGWLIYAKGGKPKFENTFKNMFLEVGPIKDIASGKFVISTKSFSEGVPSDEYSLYANSAILGAYNRAVNTQVSGAKTKEFAVAFQSLVVTEDDCKTDHTIEVTVDKSSLKSIKWRWILNPSYDDKDPDSEKWIVVTPDNLNSFLGKTVHCRTPLFCKSKNGLCWKCVGEIYRRLGMVNVGLSLQRLTSTFLNSSLKSMHDATIKTSKIKWKDKIFKIVDVK